MITLILLSQDVGEFALGIFHLVSLIDHDVLPIILVQLQPVLKDEIVGGDADIPLGSLHHAQSLVTSVGVALIDYFPDGWCPFLEFSHPVGNGG